MKYVDAVAYIHAHKRFAPAPTLDRMRKFMALLGNPQDALTFVHVAGTNGKGSTAAMTAGVLREAGYKTGLTVSPYIIDFRERMQVNGEMISQERLAGLVEEVSPLAGQVENLTEFELVTGLAFLWFAEEKCEIVVAEVGLGGQFDATNIIAPPLVTVVTKIGLDHTEILGDTVEKIAAEKAAIIKAGSAGVVLSPNQPKQAEAVLCARCAQQGCSATIPLFSDAQIQSMDLWGTKFLYRGHSLFIPLAGAHQVENALMVIAACEVLAKTGFPKVAQALEAGLAKTRFPARMEVLGKNPPVIVDGAHNPDGAVVLAAALALIGDCPLVGVIGMAADKDTRKVISLLAPRFTRLICTTPETPRALAAEELAALCAPHCAQVESCTQIAQACAHGCAYAKQLGGALVVFGSFYLAAPARQILLAYHEDLDAQ